MKNVTSKEMGHHTTALLPLIISSVLDAGKAILKIYQGDIAIEYKSDQSPLTAADRASHDTIEKQLNDLPDKIPILSEEGRDIPYRERKKWHTFWLVDPLDGTKEFIKKNGEFTVNIALIQNVSPLLGVVYVPVKKTLYYGAKGIGAGKLTHTDRFSLPLSTQEIVQASDPLSGRESSHGLTVIGSRSHGSEAFETFMKKMKKQYDKVDLISAGSSLKFCLVAEGVADIYPRFGPTMEWDTAAGQAVVEQAGGVVLDARHQTPLQYNKENLLNPWFIVKKRHGRKIV